MMEGLARETHREVRALNYELTIHGLSLYGLMMVMWQVGVPAVVAVPTVTVLASATVYRWLQRRWAAHDLNAVG